MPRHRFKKGEPRPAGAGRKKNTPNKTTVIVKEVLEEVAQRLGGADGMYRWAKRDPANETIFWSSMYPRLLPVHLQAHVAQQLIVSIKREELVNKLQERGIPTQVFGAKVPLLELKAEPVKGNGKANGSDSE